MAEGLTDTPQGLDVEKLDTFQFFKKKRSTFSRTAWRTLYRRDGGRGRTQLRNRKTPGALGHLIGFDKDPEGAGKSAWSSGFRLQASGMVELNWHADHSQIWPTTNDQRLTTAFWPTLA